MTAGVMISLYMGYIHGGIIDSGGMTHFGDIPPVGRGLTPKKIFFSYIYFLYRLGVGNGLVGHDCGSDDIAIYRVYAWC